MPKRQWFFNAFCYEIIKQTYSRWEEWADRAKRFLSRLSPRFSFGTDPVNDFSLSLDVTNSLQSNNDILNLPQRIAEDKNTNIVVCIDEFQQIGDFSDSLSFQKKLRGQWQLQQNVSYCLYGSKMHLLNGFFTNQSMPFYKFGDISYSKRLTHSTGFLSFAIGLQKQASSFHLNLRKEFAILWRTTLPMYSSLLT